MRACEQIPVPELVDASCMEAYCSKGVLCGLYISTPSRDRAQTMYDLEVLRLTQDADENSKYKSVLVWVNGTKEAEFVRKSFRHVHENVANAPQFVLFQPKKLVFGAMNGLFNADNIRELLSRMTSREAKAEQMGEAGSSAPLAAMPALSDTTGRACAKILEEQSAGDAFNTKSATAPMVDDDVSPEPPKEKWKAPKRPDGKRGVVEKLTSEAGFKQMVLEPNTPWLVRFGAHEKEAAADKKKNKKEKKGKGKGGDAAEDDEADEDAKEEAAAAAAKKSPAELELEQFVNAGKSVNNMVRFGTVDCSTAAGKALFDAWVVPRINSRADKSTCNGQVLVFPPKSLLGAAGKTKAADYYMYAGAVEMNAVSEHALALLKDVVVDLLNEKTWHEFVTTNALITKVVMITEKDSPPILAKALAVEFYEFAQVAYMHPREAGLMKQFQATKAPAVRLLKSSLGKPDSEGRMSLTLNIIPIADRALHFNGVAFALDGTVDVRHPSFLSPKFDPEKSRGMTQEEIEEMNKPAPKPEPTPVRHANEVKEEL